jgi:hypothetical protein
LLCKTGKVGEGPGPFPAGCARFDRPDATQGQLGTLKRLIQARLSVACQQISGKFASCLVFVKLAAQGEDCRWGMTSDPFSFLLETKSGFVFWRMNALIIK